MSGKKGDEYICYVCKGTFERSRDDVEAEKAARVRGETADDLVLVCDDCFKKVMSVN